MKLIFIILFLPFYLVSYPVYQAEISSLQDADWYLTGGVAIMHLSHSLDHYLTQDIQEKTFEEMKYWGSVLIVFNKKETASQLSLDQLSDYSFFFKDVDSIRDPENKKFHTITKSYSQEPLKDILKLFPLENYPPCITFLSEKKDELDLFKQQIKMKLPNLWYCNLVYFNHKEGVKGKE